MRDAITKAKLHRWTVKLPAMKACIVIATLVFAAGTVRADCDDCKDLCRLMDEYLQKEVGIKIWSWYAKSTPEPQRSEFVPTDVENLGFDIFTAWTKWRKLPCRRDKSVKGSGSVAEDIVTNFKDEKCEIQRNKQKLEGDVLKQYIKDVGCKALSDASVAHEEVHREDCMRAYSEGHPERLDDQSEVADSELRAWKKHQQIVADKIREIIQTKGCGWSPTAGQKKNINALPSRQQIMDMQKRGWRAAKALSRGKR